CACAATNRRTTMKRASAQGAPQAGHFNCAKNRNVPLKCPAPRVRKNKGKTAKNFLVSIENRSGVGQSHRAGHFDFPKHSKCPAEVSRCHPATVGADALDHSTSRKQAAFRVVLADPPWLFRSNSQAAPERNPRRHPCLTVDQLCQRPLAEQVSRDAVLFPCVLGPLLVI